MTGAVALPERSDLPERSGPPERLLVVGHGMAAVRLVEELDRRCPGRHAVTVVGAEARGGYNRVLLSSVLAGDTPEAEAALRGTEWYEARGVRVVAGRRVAALDLALGEAALEGGEVIAFDRVVLATGSHPVRLARPGMDLPGVVSFRDLADLGAMRALAPGAPVVVVGGGLLGIEAASGLARRGARVALLHVVDRLMERQLDPRGAAHLRRALERRGIAVRLRADTARVLGADRATGVELTDGAVLPAALVVVAVGVRPNADLAREAGLAVNRGIVVDDGLDASAPRAHALGECAEHRGQAHGLVEPAYDQARVLARRLAGEAAAYEGWVPSTNLKVSGVPVFSAGALEGEEAVTFEDVAAGHYRRVVLSGGRVTGCVLVGDAGDAAHYRALIASGEPVGARRDRVVFGPDPLVPGTLAPGTLAPGTLAPATLAEAA